MNKHLFLIDDIHDKNIEKDATRSGFGRGLVEAGTQNENVVALCADLTDSTKMNGFADAFPERFVEIGIAEQNLINVGAGMAAMGKIPFCASYAAFNPGRNFDQIRTMVCMSEWPVKIVGAHAGISVGPDGGTHQMLEDIAMMRALPGMVVVVPGDAVEAEKATVALAQDERPAYIRLGREATPVFTTERTPFKLGDAYVYTEGKDLTIVSTGAMTYQALSVAESLYSEGIDVEVIHCPTIKPFDGRTVLASAEKTGAVVTIEEAQIAGGLGSTVAEFLAEHHPVPMKRLGARDRFGESGTPDELLDAFGLTPKKIITDIHTFMNSIGRQ